MAHIDRNILKLNVAYFLLGFTALFGEFLHDLPPSVITLGRTAFASIFLLVYIVAARRNFSKIKKIHWLSFAGAGILLSFHWTAFFQSVQLGSVAIAVLTFTTFPVFSALLEPVFFKEPFSVRNIVLSLICLIGIYLVIPNFNLSSGSFQGVAWGIFSGFTFALLSLLNRSLAKAYTEDVLTFYQLAFAVQCLVASFVLFPAGANTFFNLNIYELLMLALLGVVFTAIPHTMVISSLKHVKVQTVGIVSTLEPVYGIVFAWILLGDTITLNMALGGLIIMVCVFIISRDKNKL